jgi:hypothetical protein
MASTINAAVGGVVITSDSSGALNIQAGGVTAIEVGANQSVTLTNLTVANVTATTFSATSLTLTNPLGAAQGGTGLTSSGASGNVLTSDGTGWVSQSVPPGAPDFIVQSYGIV